MYKRLAKKISKIKSPKLRRSIAAQVGGQLESYYCLQNNYAEVAGWKHHKKAVHDWKKWDSACDTNTEPKVRD